MLNEYIIKDNKRLRLGYTTGTCAAAASKAAALMLVGGVRTDQVTIMTPKKIGLTLDVLEASVENGTASCAIRKDSGDDPDVTNGMLIYARVTLSRERGVRIEGGVGIGRVTKPGLECEVGTAAINRVPREMIAREVGAVLEGYGSACGAEVVISAPEGEEIARRTFNPRLGIVGGISILGTSGIVEPMSDAALVDTIKAELNIRAANGDRYLLITPGNYGEDYIKDKLRFDPELAVKCSNFIGDTLSYAVEKGFEGVLLIGHIGKLVKLAGGLMNTHSKYGDCRMEILTAYAAVHGADADTARALMECVTTDDAIRVLDEHGLREGVMRSVIQKIKFYMDAAGFGKLRAESIMFSSKYGLLAMTDGAHGLAELMTKGRE